MVSKENMEFLRQMQEQLEGYGKLLEQFANELERRESELAGTNEALKKAKGDAEVLKSDNSSEE